MSKNEATIARLKQDIKNYVGTDLDVDTGNVSINIARDSVKYSCDALQDVIQQQQQPQQLQPLTVLQLQKQHEQQRQHWQSNLNCQYYNIMQVQENQLVATQQQWNQILVNERVLTRPSNIEYIPDTHIEEVVEFTWDNQVKYTKREIIYFMDRYDIHWKTPTAYSFSADYYKNVTKNTALATKLAHQENNLIYMMTFNETKFFFGIDRSLYYLDSDKNILQDKIKKYSGELLYNPFEMSLVCKRPEWISGCLNNESEQPKFKQGWFNHEGATPVLSVADYKRANADKIVFYDNQKK